MEENRLPKKIKGTRLENFPLQFILHINTNFKSLLHSNLKKFLNVVNAQMHSYYLEDKIPWPGPQSSSTQNYLILPHNRLQFPFSAKLTSLLFQQIEQLGEVRNPSTINRHKAVVDLVRSKVSKEMQTKIDKWDQIKLKNTCTAKETINKNKKKTLRMGESN